MGKNKKAPKKSNKAKKQAAPEQLKKKTEKSSTFKVGALIVSIVLVLAFALPSAGVLLSLSTENAVEQEYSEIEKALTDFRSKLITAISSGDEN